VSRRCCSHLGADCWQEIFGSLFFGIFAGNILAERSNCPLAWQTKLSVSFPGKRESRN